MQLFTLSTNGGSPRQITFTNFDHGAPKWYNNDSQLYFSANFHEDEELEPVDSEIYKIEISDGTIKPLTKRYGPDTGSVLSPDGTKIAYTGFDDRYQGYQITYLYVMNADGTNSKLISKGFDRDIQNLNWSTNGKGLYFQFDDKGTTKFAHTTTGGKVTEIAQNLGGVTIGRPYGGGSYSTNSEGQYVYTMSNPDRPSDLVFGKYESDWT